MIDQLPHKSFGDQIGQVFFLILLGAMIHIKSNVVLHLEVAISTKPHIISAGFVCVCVVPHSDGVDVAGVSREGLLAGSFPHVPQFGQGVAGSGDEGVLVGGQSQGHAVSNVVGEDDLLLAGLQVPQAAGEQNKFVLCYYLIIILS